MRWFHAKAKPQDLTPWAAYQQRRQAEHKTKRRQRALKLPAVSALRRHNQWRNLAVVLVPLLILLGFFGYMVTPAAKVGPISVSGETVTTAQAVIDASGLSETDPVIQVWATRGQIGRRIGQKLPALAKVQVSITGLNHIHLRVKEHAALGYVQKGDQYHLLMANGAVLAASTTTPATNYPTFIGFSHQRALTVAKTVHAFPVAVRRAVSEVRTTKGAVNPYQITMMMTDGNTVVADSRTVLKRIRYYREIIAQVKGKGTVDLEVGAYFTPYATAAKK